MGLIEWRKEGKKEHINNIKDNIKDRVESLINTVSQNWGSVRDWVKESWNQVTDKFKKDTTNEDTNINGNSNPQITAENQDNGIGTYLNQTPTVTEDTSSNNDIITSVQDNASKMLEKYWEREDNIRNEIQEREDTAFQRAVSDMRKSGINPNLVGISPASSSGGLTNATKIEELGATLLNNYTQKDIAELQRSLDAWATQIKIDTTISEGEKDRVIESIKAIGGIISGLFGSMIGMAS